MLKKGTYPRSIWILAVGMTINVTGNSFLWPLNTIYITEVLHKSLSFAGLVLMMQQGIGILGSLIGGWLFDRWGSKKTIVTGIILSIMTVFSLGFVYDIRIYIVLMLLLGFSTALVFPSMYAMAGTLWPEGGTKAYNIIYVAQNLGVALGSTFGGLIAQISFQYIFFFNALAFIPFILLMLLGLKKEEWQKAEYPSFRENPMHSMMNLPNLQKKQFFSLLILSAAFVLTWIPYVQWQTSISFYIKSIGIPLSHYTLLWTINGSLIVLGQPIIYFLTKKLLNTEKKQMGVGVLIFLGAFIILYDNQLFSGFVLAMIVMTLAEMLVWPAVPSAAAELAPEGRKGFYQGVISSAGAGGRMLGYLFGGWLYDHTSMNILILLMMFFFAISGVFFINYDRSLRKKKIVIGKEF